ncbi:MAG TPA: hypothetical protein VMR76_01625 [Candidatus Saccharimonadia bacterium]|nr:hypothetical protein [Candidatus Saccharimonadia bacterium]
MSRTKESTLVPLSELADYSDVSLEWRVNFPEFAPTSQIGVNLDRIKFLSNLAGLRHLRVDSESGETSSHQPQISGIDAQGNATASMRVAKTEVSLSEADVTAQKSGRKNTVSEYIWGDGHITVNTSEFNQRVLDASHRKNGPTLRQPQEWAGLLDRSLSRGITQSARKQLLGNVTGFSTITNYIACGTVVINMPLIISNPALGIAEACIDISLIHTITATLAWAEGHSLRERRWSLIPGYQVDRLFMVNALARTTKLARVIK